MIGRVDLAESFTLPGSRDDALNEDIADPNDNVSHHIAEPNLFNCSAQFFELI